MTSSHPEHEATRRWAMAVEMPSEEIGRADSQTAELAALRAAHALGARLEISELELRERVRSLGRSVAASRSFTERNVVTDEGLRAFLAASAQLDSAESELLLTTQARRRVEEEIRIRTRWCLEEDADV